jgi:hypothetical protein
VWTTRFGPALQLVSMLQFQSVPRVSCRTMLCICWACYHKNNNGFLFENVHARMLLVCKSLYADFMVLLRRGRKARRFCIQSYFPLTSLNIFILYSRLQFPPRDYDRRLVCLTTSFQLRKFCSINGNVICELEKDVGGTHCDPY